MGEVLRGERGRCGGWFWGGVKSGLACPGRSVPNGICGGGCPGRAAIGPEPRACRFCRCCCIPRGLKYGIGPCLSRLSIEPCCCICRRFPTASQLISVLMPSASASLSQALLRSAMVGT